MTESEEKLKETATVEKYDGSNFELWKMHMMYVFQSRDLYGIVAGTETKANCTTDEQQARWERRDKHAIVAILAAIIAKYRHEVINCSTSHAMWTQLAVYYEQHSEECIVVLQEKFYSARLTEGESIATFVSTVQHTAKQLNDLNLVITERQILSKIKCSLPSSFQPLLLAWDSVPINDQTLKSFQTRLIKHELHLRESVTDVQADKAFYSQTTTS